MGDDSQGRYEARYAADASGRVGCVVDVSNGIAYLRPPGGGREWHVDMGEIRPLTEEEMESIAVLTTPVAGSS